MRHQSNTYLQQTASLRNVRPVVRRLYHILWTSCLTVLLFWGFSHGQETQMRGFGEILFKASDVDGSHSTFTFGEVVLFFTSDLTDRITVLNETTFKPG